MEIYSFQATDQSNPEYLVGTNPMVHTLNAFVIPGDDGTGTINYQLLDSDGVTNAVDAHDWLSSVDLTAPSLTISTTDES